MEQEVELDDDLKSRGFPEGLNSRVIQKHLKAWKEGKLGDYGSWLRELGTKLTGVEFGVFKMKITQGTLYFDEVEK